MLTCGGAPNATEILASEIVSSSASRNGMQCRRVVMTRSLHDAVGGSRHRREAKLLIAQMQSNVAASSVTPRGAQCGITAAPRLLLVPTAPVSKIARDRIRASRDSLRTTAALMNDARSAPS